MISKEATETRILKVGQDVIVVSGVKGDATLQRVMINSTFSGYLQNREGEYYRLDGHNIHNLIFAKLCQLLK